MIGQTIQQIESVTNKMCESLSSVKDVKEEEKITLIAQKHIPEFFEKFNVSSQAQADTIANKIFFRLQKNCDYFVTMLTKLEENKSDWTRLTEKPKSELSKKACTTFFTGGNFYYKEHNGKIVNVKMTANSWTETFEDNTTSKLKFIPKNNCEFELEFIESNNISRKNLSVKGDIYKYGIYNLKEDIYYIWATTDEGTVYSFRLYPKK